MISPTNPHPEADVSTQDEAMINDSSKQIPTRERSPMVLVILGTGSCLT